MASEKDLIIQDIGNKGIIILNKPKALNAISLPMAISILDTLKKWENEKILVIVKGAGDKAFCAGGDVKSVVETRMKGEKYLSLKQQHVQYALCALTKSYKIPYVSFIDGIVMGAGAGLSFHGRYRVATERTMFAMPEAHIGLIPDVGSSFIFPRLPGRLGWYLALTGQRLKGSDVFRAGIATHFCDIKRLNDLERDLMKCFTGQEIDATLNQYNDNNAPDFSLAPLMHKINYCFSAETVEEIISRLEQDGTKWSETTLSQLRKNSPTSLKLVYKEMTLGAKLKFENCLEMEYRAVVNCLEAKDFYEGVRAQIIEKDQKPKWNPPTLSEVSDDYIDKYFAKLPDNEELKHKL